MSLQRKSTPVDILLGCDYFGLHPKQEEAGCGANLSIMSGEFEICVQGTHLDLREETEFDANLVKTIHDSKIKVENYHICRNTYPEFQPAHVGVRLSPLNNDIEKDKVNSVQ